MADTPKYHPALTITNVKSLIPITLDAEHGMYHSWAALFKVLVRIHDLHHHIIPPTDETEVAAYAASKAADPALWKRLDAAVLQWIYGTISMDLLQAILLKNDTAHGAWARLESMFQDNKVSRATHLEDELAALDFENFSSIDHYCNHIKSLADRLADVDAPLSNSRLVLKLTGGLPEAYAGTVDFIQNQEPLPSFESCRSRLKLAERTIKNRLAKEGGLGTRSNTALITSSGGHGPDRTTAPVSSSRQPSKNGKSKKSTSKPPGKGRHNAGQGVQNPPGPNSLNWQQQHWASWAPWLHQWPTPPPCPYPVASWAPRPAVQHASSRPTGPGLLGPRPQAYNAVAPSYNYTPTDIEAAMNALTVLNQTEIITWTLVLHLI
ncbi:uncharacterized protein LOC130591869 [Beta vulgaris subsp. vulgaris]|uniref:uncharacterized protein LOC130591869 n=1 Tax=Beta vulgaris subsp. vulgaris TaxID=3555 RepID=UPI0025482DE8|nr:uncharacterized protein LOC130591869 [Beta vulgaris subsp. vulgaris]